MNELYKDASKTLSIDTTDVRSPNINDLVFSSTVLPYIEYSNALLDVKFDERMRAEFIGFFL
jgi:hypothetical protein